MSKYPKKSSNEIRHFDETVRKSIVKEIDEGLSKAEAARKYNVSRTTIFKWYRIYSTQYTKKLRTVVEKKSTSNKYKQLEKELNQTYELLGRSQTKRMYLEKLIEIASKELGVDLKKSFGTNASNTFMKSKKD